MFIGREKELKQLEKQYSSHKFEFAVIYGRRRIGKTSLIQEFIKNKKNIFFTGIETNEKQNLVNLSHAIISSDDMNFDSYQKAIEYVFSKAVNERLIFVIDEYPYLANAYPAISSILQSIIDKNKDNTKLFLILCGSSLSFMEEQVLGYQSPLYGRRTSQYKIKPFTYFESKKYFKNYTNKEKAVIYGITSGIPLYLSLINENLSLKDNIIDNFLSANGYLYEEPTSLIKQECREPAIYNSIIQVIAEGATRLSDIANKVGLETGVTTIYIKKLLALGIVKKEYPIYKPTKRKTIYQLDDSMFIFWYKFIPKYISMINMGMGEIVYDNIEKYIPEFMDYIFEDICKQYLWKLNISNQLPYLFTNLGKWWGNDSRLKSEVEIDILGYNENDEAIIGECKWRNEKVDLTVLNELLYKAQIFDFKDIHYYLFSKSGFSEACINKAKENNKIHLITFKEMNK